jgi:hypothetical protein
MPKQWRQHYLTYTATKSQWQFQLSKISQQTVMYMKTDITYGIPSVNLFLLIILSRITGVSVTDYNGFYIWWLSILALLYNCIQFRQLTINDCLQLAPFLAGPSASSLPLWWMMKEEFLLTPWTALKDVCLMNESWRVSTAPYTGQFIFMEIPLPWTRAYWNVRY